MRFRKGFLALDLFIFGEAAFGVLDRLRQLVRFIELRRLIVANLFGYVGVDVRPILAFFGDRFVKLI